MTVIFIGPSNQPVTGQSLAFHNLVSGYESDKYIIYYSSLNFIGKIASFIVAVIKMLTFIMFGRKKVSSVYITTSRSRVGFFRDAIIIIIANLFNKSVVNHLHGADFKYFRESQPSLIRFMVDYVYSKVDKSIVLLPRMVEQYDCYPSMKVFSVSNGVSSNYSCECLKNSKQILFLSNVMYSKGITYLIEAIEELNSEGFNFSLKVAGEFLGDEFYTASEIKTIFEEKVAKCKFVEYLGPVHGEAKASLLAASQFFILPTFYRTEAQPLSIIEAMSAGCTIIATKHNYLEDMVDSSNGALVDVKSVDQIRDAILFLSNDVERLTSISCNNQSIAQLKYSLDRYVKQVTKIVNEG